MSLIREGKMMPNHFASEDNTFYYIFGVCGAPNPLCTTYITFVTLIILLGYVGAPKIPIFAPTHRLHLYIYIIELSMSVSPNHIFAPHIS